MAIQLLTTNPQLGTGKNNVKGSWATASDYYLTPHHTHFYEEQVEELQRRCFLIDTALASDLPNIDCRTNPL